MPPIFAYPSKFTKPFSTAGLLARATGLAPMQLRMNRGRKSPDLDSLAQRIILPSLPLADEDLARLQHWEKGRKLARQEDWQALSELITIADDARLTTPGGADEASLMALGAQSDVLAAVSDALADGCAPDPAGIQALEDVAQEYPDDPALCMVVAMAHLNIGRAWMHSTGDISRLVSPERTHFKRAQELIEPFDAMDLDAPSVALLQASVAEILCLDMKCVSRVYARLLELDMENASHLRAYGRAMAMGLPEDPTILEKAANELEPRIRTFWGDAGYALMHLDVLGHDNAALAAVDAQRFTESLKDLLLRRTDQYLINQLAAFFAIDMAPREKEDTRSLARKRATLQDNLDWLLTNHLAELHPMLWAGTQARPITTPRDHAPRALVAQGRKRALHVIAKRFADQMSDGGSIAFSPSGMYRLPAI